jgi:hypothetical protein
MLIRQMTLEEVFKKAVSCSAAELENPVPGSSSDVTTAPYPQLHKSSPCPHTLLL